MSTWADGMQTFQYNILGKIGVKHVFTGNREELQKEQGQLWEDFQIEVPMMKDASGLCFPRAMVVIYINLFIRRILL